MQLPFSTILRDFDSLHLVLTELIAGGIKPERINLVAADSDGLREATVPLQTKRFDKAILYLAGVGFVIGGIWGYVACPVLDVTLPSAIIASGMAVFCGMLLGALAGAHVGGIIQLDNGPMTDAVIQEGKVDGGVAVITVVAETASDVALVSGIFSRVADDLSAGAVISDAGVVADSENLLTLPHVSLSA